jgi:hypothetical protein
MKVRGRWCLANKVGECLIGKLLQALAAVAREQFESLLSFRIEADQFAGP